MIRKIKDYIFTTFAFPLAFDVAAMFWSLFLFDRNLVAPKEWDPIFPVWLNHFIHTDIVIFISIELIILHRHYPSMKYSLMGLFFFVLMYIGWIHVIYFETEKWVYPIIETLNWIERIGFYGLCLIIPTTFYFFGKFLNNLVWNENRVAKIIREKREESYEIWIIGESFGIKLKFIIGIFI